MDFLSQKKCPEFHKLRTTGLSHSGNVRESVCLGLSLVSWRKEWIVLKSLKMHTFNSTSSCPRQRTTWNAHAPTSREMSCSEINIELHGGGAKENKKKSWGSGLTECIARRMRQPQRGSRTIASSCAKALMREPLFAWHWCVFPHVVALFPVLPICGYDREETRDRISFNWRMEINQSISAH